MKVNQIIHGDCLEVMKEMPDKSMDLCLTDFPYGIGENYNEYKDTKENLIALIDNAMPEILRISKRALITCGVSNIFLYPEPLWILNWFNKAGCGSGPWGFCCWQPILAYYQDLYLQNGKGRQPDSIETNEISPKNGHPCPKPLQFWKKLLIRGSVFKNETILDPFSGSGTTAIACLETNRNYICIEKDKTYYDLSVKRVNDYLSQINMEFI